MAEITIPSPITGKLWKIVAQEGDEVDVDGLLLIFESMKMEIPVHAPEAGCVRRILLKEGDDVEEGDAVAVLDARS